MGKKISHESAKERNITKVFVIKYFGAIWSLRVYLAGEKLPQKH
jgi:hypothetical protein